MLWPVLYSMVELMAFEPGRPPVRLCAAKECRLYFVDRSRSRQRRWCDAKVCGARTRSLRHYHRKGAAKRESYKRRAGIWRVKRPRKAKS